MSQLLKHKIRKELSRWSRKLLLTVGLESIGRELVGQTKWEQIYPLQQVSASDFQHFDFDFDPQQLSASNDNSTLDPSEEEERNEEEPNEEDKNDIFENLFNFLPYWYFINRAFATQETSTSSSNPNLNSTHPIHSTISDYSDYPADQLNQINLNNNGILGAIDAQRLLFLQSLEQQQLQQNRQNNSPQLTTTTSSEFNSEFIPDEPLDLTKKNKGNVTEIIESSNDLNQNYQNQNGAGRNGSNLTKPNQRTGRGYTTEELQAALNDIQSGKLGTRRAAVIYGIPRSTLRNKVYKMGKDRAFIRQSGRKRIAVTDTENKTTNLNLNLNSNNSNNSQILQETSLSLRSSDVEIGKSKSKSTCGFVPFFIKENYGNDDDVEEGEEGEESLDMDNSEISPEKKVLKEWLRTKLSRQLPIEYSNRSPMTMSAGGIDNESSEEVDEENSDNSNGPPTNVILKVPSPSPLAINNKSTHNLRRKRNGIPMNRWKDETQLNFDYDSEIDALNSSQSNQSNGGMSKGQLVNKSANQSVMDVDEKKSRPKRGKYRNYDRDALLKAVKAVQNGEMSVHRAGSYFGVPHSTLEYKVKERHLLRRPKRKIDGGGGGGVGAGSPKSTQRSTPESSLSGSELPSNHDEISPETHAVGGLNSLPLSSDLRETLSRYLNLTNSSSPSSPDQQDLNLVNSSTSNSNSNSNSNSKCINDHHSGQLRALNILDKFSKIRENNSLLDLSKKC